MTARADEPHIGLIVEGRGEQQAVPLLLRLHLTSQDDYRDILSAPIVCHGRDKALMPDGIEGFVATAAARPGCRGVLILLDAETDRACERGPELLARAQTVTGKPVVVCLAEPQYEAWLVASAETLELDDLAFEPSRNPEVLIREALTAKYIKPTWQPRLTARMDLALATPRSRSLERFFDRFDYLLERLP
jgi:hypothetical protein